MAKPKLLTEFINLGLPVSGMIFSEKHKVLFLSYEKKNIKAKIDRGQDPEDIRPGLSRGRSEPLTDPILAETLKVVDLDGHALDVMQLDADSELILVERAKMSSHILQRVTHVQSVGGGQLHVRRRVQVVYRNLWIWSGRADGSADAPPTRSNIRIIGGCHRAVGREVQQVSKACT